MSSGPSKTGPEAKFERSSSKASLPVGFLNAVSSDVKPKILSAREMPSSGTLRRPLKNGRPSVETNAPSPTPESTSMSRGYTSSPIELSNMAVLFA